MKIDMSSRNFWEFLGRMIMFDFVILGYVLFLEYTGIETPWIASTIMVTIAIIWILLPLIPSKEKEKGKKYYRDKNKIFSKRNKIVKEFTKDMQEYKTTDGFSLNPSLINFISWYDDKIEKEKKENEK